MASLEVSKKVSFLGSWNEDVFSDEIVRTIAARAKTEKGKTMKVNLNETGLKLTRSRFWQEIKSTLFPIKDLRAVTRSPESSKCALFILSNSDKKYKIIALRCSSEGDASYLINTFSEIQKKLQVTNVELKKRDNGNWTLREKRVHTSGRKVTDVFNENKLNGDVIVKVNGNVTSRPAPDEIDSHPSPKGVYRKRNKTGSNNSYKVIREKVDGGGDTYAEEYVIETEVMPHGNTTTPIQTRHTNDSTKRSTTTIKHASSKDHRDGNRGQDQDKAHVYSEQNILPSSVVRYTGHETGRSQVKSGKSTPPSRVIVYTGEETNRVQVVSRTSNQPSRASVNEVEEASRSQVNSGKSIHPPRAVVYTSEEANRSQVNSGKHIHPSRAVVYTSEESNRSQVNSVKHIHPSRAVVYTSEETNRFQVNSGKNIHPSRAVVYTSQETNRSQVNSGKNIHPSRAVVFTSEETNRSEMNYGKTIIPSRSVIYTGQERRSHVHAAQSSLPPRAMVYTATLRNTMHSKPVILREPQRIYEGRIDYPAGYYINPRSTRGRVSTQSEMVPVRVWGPNWNMKIDQRSIRSNTSKQSQSSKKVPSESHFPTTIVRSIEDTYPRPNVVFSRSPGQVQGSRPATYHVVEASDLRMYPADEEMNTYVCQ